MANTPLMSERRTAVRMLQSPCLDVEPSGAAAPKHLSACGSSSASQQFAAVSSSSIRRRSVCFPASSSALIDESATGGDPIRRAVSTTAPASPALPRRPTLLDSPDGGPQPSPRSVTIPLDPDAPSHLSVPLALLSLHNGGGIRHSPRCSRAPSCAGLPPFKDGTPPCGTSTDTVIRIDVGQLGNALSPERKHSTTGSIGPMALSPPRHSNLMLPTSLPSPPFDNPAAASSLVAGPATPATPTRAARTSCPSGGAAATATAIATGIATANLNSTFTTTSVMSSQTTSLTTAPSSPTAPRASSGVVPSTTTTAATALAATSAAAAVTEGEANSGVSSAAITLPTHLSSFRPPTPICREDDLLASMHVVTSPTRRRSRFASVAECNLMAATAAAVAAEEGALLDSTTYGDSLASLPSFSGSAGVVGIGMGAGLLAESRSRRSLVPTASFTDLLGSSAVGGSGAGGGANGTGGGAEAAGGDQVLEVQPVSLRLVGVAGGVRGGLDSIALRSAGSMVWRTAPQLGTVPEEPSTALTHSDSNDGNSPRKCGSGAITLTPMSPFTSPASGRRLRANSTCSRTNADMGRSSFPETSSLSSVIPNSDLPTHGTAAAPYDDSLSSFMCSFGPAPGTPVGDRRSDVAQLEVPQAVTPATAGTGRRITAR